MKVGQQHDVDVGIRQAKLCQAIEQRVAAFLDAVALLHRGVEEGADAGLDQDVALTLAHQQRAAAQQDAVLFIGCHPALPERLGRIAEHGAAVEALAVASQGGQRAATGGGPGLR